MDELRECPFCGKKVAEYATVWECEQCANFQEPVCQNYQDWPEECGIHLVVCPSNRGGCGASTGWHISKEDAANAWNRRKET